MKKVLVMFLSFILVLSLIGCNKQESDGAKTETTENGNGTINVEFLETKNNYNRIIVTQSTKLDNR